MGELALPHFSEREVAKSAHRETGIDDGGWGRRKSWSAVRFGDARVLFAFKSWKTAARGKPCLTQNFVS